MTREEAIKRLKELRSGNWWAFEDPNEIDITNEALDMAIEALHREEAEEKGYCHRIIPSNFDELSATNTEKSSNCGDLISRVNRKEKKYDIGRTARSYGRQNQGNAQRRNDTGRTNGGKRTNKNHNKHSQTDD